MPNMIIEPMIAPVDATSSKSVVSENPYEEIIDPDDPYKMKYNESIK